MTTGKVLWRLVHYSPLVFDGLVLSRHRCILATRIGIDTLAAFNIEAHPRPVIACVANAPYATWKGCADRGHRGAPPPEAWAVWSGLPVEVADPVQPKSWPGHLVVHVPRAATVLDLDFQAFARPAKLLDTPPAVAVSWPAGLPVCHYVGRDRCRRLFVVRYEDNPDNRGYTAAKDWRSDRAVVRDTVQTLARAIRKGSAV